MGTWLAPGEVPTLAIDFNDVRIGYFGQSADLDRVARNPRGFSDLESAFAAALEPAGAVWCADWNQVGGDLESLAADAYHAPMETSQAFFTEAAGA